MRKKIALGLRYMNFTSSFPVMPGQILNRVHFFKSILFFLFFFETHDLNMTKDLLRLSIKSNPPLFTWAWD